jgi:predicted dienelactone hydrolase
MVAKRLFFILLIVVLALPALAITPFAGAQENKPPAVGLRPDAPPYALHGPYCVGTREFVIEDAERPLQGTLWYPALNPEGRDEAVTYSAGLATIAPSLDAIQGHALRDAAPDTSRGPYPLVVFSHGLGMARVGCAYLLEHLASWGFVAMAIDHPGSTLADSERANTKSWRAAYDYRSFGSLVTRPVDIRRAIGYAETLTAGDSAFAGVIAMDHIAVVGYSLGGYTALVSAGGRLHFKLPNAEANPEACSWTPMLCELFAEQTTTQREIQLIDLGGVKVHPGDLWPSLGDPRVDAIMPLAPALSLAFGTDGLEQVKVPALVLGASRDRVVGTRYGAGWVYDHLDSAQKGIIVFENGNHFLFGECGSPAWMAIAFDQCSDPVWDMDRAHDLINHFATAFLLATLKGDTDAAAVLAPDAVSFPGITYEEQGF